MTEPLTIIGVVLAAISSFLFSGMEAGVFALSRVRIRQMMRQGNRRAALLHGYLEHPERFLWTILTGNTMANFVLVALLVTRLFEVLHQRLPAFWTLLGLALFAFYVLLDLLPKTLFRRFPNRLCLLTVESFRWQAILLQPVVALLAWLAAKLAPGSSRSGQIFGNREELRVLMESAQNPLSSEERTLVNRVLNLQKHTVQRVTIPWDKVTRIAEHLPVTTAHALLVERGCSRLPVTSADEREVLGLLSLKTLLFRERLDPAGRARDYMTPALRFDAGTRLEDALRQFQQSGHRQAIVQDAAHRPIGIVSLTDVLKTIFGEVTL